MCLLGMECHSSTGCCRYAYDHKIKKKKKDPLRADLLITEICHCRFISFIMASKNVYAAAFVINDASCGSAKIKAFKRMSFS